MSVEDIATHNILNKPLWAVRLSVVSKNRLKKIHCASKMALQVPEIDNYRTLTEELK